jgi:hypothetical protein
MTAELFIELYQGLKLMLSEILVDLPPTVPEMGVPPCARLKGFIHSKARAAEGDISAGGWQE